MRGSYLPNSCCEFDFNRHSAHGQPILPQPTNTHSARPYRKPQYPQLTPAISLHCWPKYPPIEARHYEIPRPTIQASPDHRLSNLPKTKRRSTRPGVTKLSLTTAAGRYSTLAFFRKSRQTQTHITTCCDRGRDTLIRRIQRTGRYSLDSGIAGSSFAHGSGATGGRPSAFPNTSMNDGVTL